MNLKANAINADTTGPAQLPIIVEELLANGASDAAICEAGYIRYKT
jgi:hypothetical protein